MLQIDCISQHIYVCGMVCDKSPVCLSGGKSYPKPPLQNLIFRTGLVWCEIEQVGEALVLRKCSGLG